MTVESTAMRTAIRKPGVLLAVMLFAASAASLPGAAAPAGADPVVRRMAIPPGTQLGKAGPPPEPSPLDAILGPRPDLSTDAACAELVRKIARTIPRDNVPALVAARKDSAELQTRLGAGRSELQNRLLERAIKVANADLAQRGLAPLPRLLAVNSGSADNFVRDVDITLFGGDKIREKALFDAIEAVAKHPDFGLRAQVGAGGLKIDLLEATFFPSGNDLPDARYAENPAKHIRDYREALQKQRAEVEAYKGSGWKLEVYAKRNPETARVMEFTWSPQAVAAVRRGYLPQNGQELRTLLHGSATRRLEKWEQASALVSPLLQAKQHGEGGDPTKGPIKYAARSVDTVCAYFDLPPWGQLKADDRVALLARVLPHLDPQTPAGRRSLEAMASALDTAQQIRAAKGTSLPAEQVVRLERISTSFLSHAVQATMSTAAAAMLEPPPLELRKDNFTADELDRYGRMSAREKHEFLVRKDENYRRCVSAEAMEDLLMAVVELRGLDIDPKTGRPAGNAGAAVLEQMKRRAPPQLRPVMNLAIEYAVVYHCASWARDVQASADATRRLYAVRAEMRKVMQQSRTPGEEVLETARRMTPGTFIARETARPGSALGEAGKAMRQRVRQATESRFPDAVAAQRRAAAELQAGPPSYLRQRVVDEMFDLGNASDALQLVEMYQGGAAAGDYVQFAAENLLGRVHWAAGFFISGAKARSEDDYRRIGHEAVFAAAARFIPGIGQVKAVFDVAQGTLNVTVGYVIQGRNAETVDCLYVGPNRTGPVNAPVVGAGTAAQALRESGFCVLGDGHFRTVRPPGERADHRVVDGAAVYRDFFRRWTNEDWDGLREAGPRGGATAPFLQAHDELAMVLLREAGRTGPLWIPPSGRSAADVAADMLAWRAPSEVEYRRAVEALYPLLEQRCRVAVRKVLEEAGARTYRSVFQAEGEDVIEQQLIQRFAADLLAGMTDAWRQRATEQPLARRQIERAAMAEDIAAIAAAVRKGAFETARPPVAPNVEFKVAVTGANVGGAGGEAAAADRTAPSAASAKGGTTGAATAAAVPVLDGGAPVVFAPEFRALDEQQNTARFQLERTEEKVTVVARAQGSANDGKVGPGDRLRTEVVFAARDGAGGLVVGTTRVVYDLVLPEDLPNELVVRRMTDTRFPPAVSEIEYIDIEPLQTRPPPIMSLHWKVPAGWRFGDGSAYVVPHGLTTVRRPDGVEVINYRYGHRHGLEKHTTRDGRLEYEAQWENGRWHGTMLRHNLSDADNSYAPAGGRAVTVYEHGNLVSHEVATGSGAVCLKMTLQRINPVTDEERTKYWDDRDRPPVYYRGHFEAFWPNGKPEMRGDFVQVPRSEIESGKADDYRSDELRRYSSPMGGELYLHGERTWWREDGSMRMRMRGSNGLKKGLFEYFHENGKLQRRGQIEGRRRVGKWEFFYESGRLEFSGEYGSDGRPKGTWLSFGNWDDRKPRELSASEIRQFAEYSDS